MLETDLLRAFPDYWTKHRRWKRRVLKLLQFTDRLFRRHQIPYFLTAGSLLGCIRHGGFIPWDDDLDIAVDRVAKGQLQTLFAEFRKNGFGVAPFWGGYKVFPDIGRRIRVQNGWYSWRWPFIDLFFYREDSDAIVLTFEKDVCFPADDIFPLIRTKFEGIDVSVPANPEAWLDRYFAPSWRTECVASRWIHHSEIWGPFSGVRVPRTALEPYYSFL